MKTESKSILTAAALICMLTVFGAPRTRAQEATQDQHTTVAPNEDGGAPQAKPASDAEDADKLRKESQNPVASLISVPIQENWNFGIEPGYRTQNVMNIQPVIPMSISQNWNLIVRWITPVIYQPVGVPQESGPAVRTGYYGLGDMQPTFFFSPKKSKVIWGLGPIFLLPTATKTGVLGQGKFGMGPNFVALVQPGKWTVGVLVNNVWSIAGNSQQPDVNQFLLQYFVNYNLNKGWYLTWNPTVTANWEASGVTSDYRWVVPFGGGIGRIMRLGHQPVNLGLQFYGNAVHPPGGSTWSMKMAITFLYPKAPKKN
jgi:hypothetical protein